MDEFWQIVSLFNNIDLECGYVTLIIEKLLSYYLKFNIDSINLCDMWHRNGQCWNKIMSGAAYNGYIDIIKYCEKKGANDWNKVMSKAAYNGHIDIVKYCGKKRANNWNWKKIMFWAANDDYIDIIKYDKIKIKIKIKNKK